MSEPTAPPPLHLDGVGVRFGRRWALRNCSLTLPQGSVAALIGPNGAGKTTLLRLATGLLRPSEGHIHVHGHAPTGAAPAGTAFVAQHAPLYSRFSVTEMVRAARTLNRHRFDTARATTMIAAAGIDATQRVRALSVGQRARVAIALAIARHPSLLLLDEPLADLDPLARKQAMGAVLAEAAELGTTVLLSSHVIADIDDACDHLVLLRDGRVQLDGPIPDLLDEHHVLVAPADHDLPAHTTPVRDVVAGRQRTAMLRGPSGPDTTRPSLEELVLAYLDPTSNIPNRSGAASSGPVSGDSSRSTS